MKITGSKKKSTFITDVGLFTALFSDEMLLTANTLLWLAFAGIVSEKKAIEIIKERIEKEKKFLTSYFQTRFKERTIKSLNDRIGWLIEFARRSEVHYDTFISILLKNFEIKILEQILPIECIARFYGSESRLKWKKLIESQR